MEEMPLPQHDTLHSGKQSPDFDNIGGLLTTQAKNKLDNLQSWL
jgi:hypothetical protein